MDLDGLQRTFLDGVYTNRIPVAIGSIVVAVLLAVVAWRAGWFAAARRHPARTGTLVVMALAIGLPLTWYLASPIWIRTELVEAAPAVVVDATRAPSSTSAGDPKPAVASPRAVSPTAAPSPSALCSPPPCDRLLPRHR